MAWTVLIVDDHAGSAGSPAGCSRPAVSSLVGEVGDGVSALAAVERLRPELVLLDVMLPDTDGFTVAEQLADPGRDRVVITSSREKADFGRRLERTPASGFIHKDDLSGPALAELIGAPR